MAAIGTDDKLEIFKRAYTGLMNSPVKAPLKEMIQTMFSFKYYGRTALFFGTAEQGTYYFFLTDDGIILEYIDGRLNVLNAKRPNENYDIQSDTEVLNNINLMFEQLHYYRLSNCFYLFVDRLHLIDYSELSKDDAKLLKLFMRSKSFKLGMYKNYPNLNKVINNIIIPYFLKSPLLKINSSQLELDMSNLEEYYLLVRNSADGEINDNIETEYSNYVDKLNTSISTTFQKYDPNISFKLNDDIDDVGNFNIISYDIKPLSAFLFQYIDDNNRHKKDLFFTLEKFETKKGDLLTDIYCNIDHICELVLSGSELSVRKISPIIDWLYQDDDKKLDHLVYNGSFLIFGASRAKKMQNYINNRIKSEFINDINNNSNLPRKRKLLSEEDFIADMRKVYQEIKQKENYKYKCTMQIVNNVKESFDLFFNNDTEVI